MDQGWIQFLLVAVPLLSLIGSWLALRAVADRHTRKADDFAADRRTLTTTEGE